MAENELLIRINGDPSDFDDALTKIQGNLKKIAKVSGVIFAGLSVVVGKTVKDFAKFDNQITGVKTLLDESSFATKGLEEGFAEMRQGLLDVGAEFPVSIEGLNKALFDTVSAGVDASQSIEFVATAAKLAVAGQTDVAIATDGLTGAINAFGLGAENAEITAAKFFTAQKFGKTTVEELAGSIGNVAALANSAGVSFEELLAATSAATTGQIKTNQAFTSLRAVISNVIKPTEDAAKEAERLGIQFDSAALRSLGLKGFLDQLTEAEGFNATSTEKLFGSVEALNVIQSLTGAQAEKFTEILGELNDKTKLATTFNKAFEEQNATLANQMKKLNNSLQGISIVLGETFAPAIGFAVEQLKDLTEFVRNNQLAVKTLAVAIGVAAAGAGLVFAIASIGLIVPAAITGLGLLAVAMGVTATAAGILAGVTGLGLIAAAVGLVLFNIDRLVNVFTGPLFAVFQFIQSAVQGFVAQFVAAFQSIQFALKGEFSLALEAAKTALVPFPIILGKAAKDSIDAFNDGWAIGTIRQKQLNAEKVEANQKLGTDLVAAAQKTSADLTQQQSESDAQTKLTQEERITALLDAELKKSGVLLEIDRQEIIDRLKAREDFFVEDIALEENKVKELLNIALNKNVEMIGLEQDFGFDILNIDQNIADSQVDIFNGGTGQLISASIDRNNRLIDIENQGFLERQAAAEAGTGERVVGIDDPLRELLDNPEKFIFGPEGFTRKIGAAGLPFEEGLSQFKHGLSGNENLLGRFSGREIVIPENFAEGIRRGRFVLEGPDLDNGRRKGRARPQNVNVRIDFKTRQAAAVLTATENEQVRLGTRRAIVQ